MPNVPSDPVPLWSIILLVVSGVVSLLSSVCLTLGIWILNSVSKRIFKVEEEVEAIKKDRAAKWLEQKDECGEEKATIARLQERLEKYNHDR